MGTVQSRSPSQLTLAEKRYRINSPKGTYLYFILNISTVHLQLQELNLAALALKRNMVRKLGSVTIQNDSRQQVPQPESTDNDNSDLRNIEQIKFNSEKGGENPSTKILLTRTQRILIENSWKRVKKVVIVLCGL